MRSCTHVRLYSQENFCTACVRGGMDASDWFPVNVKLRQGCVTCVMSPRLFNVYMDGVVREVNAWVLGKAL